MLSNRLLSLTVLIMTALLLSACAAVQRPLAPQVQLAGLEMDDITLTHANMMARVRMYNPNNYSLRVEGIRMKMHLNQVQIATGSALGPIDLPSQGSGDMLVRVSTPLWSFFNLANSLQGTQDVDFKLAGDVDTGGWGLIRGRIPFSHSGTIPLQGNLPRE